MSFPDYDQVSKWLLLFGQNAALAMVVVALCAILRPLVENKGYALPRIVIGTLFGCGAIVAMTYPIPFLPGVLIDMRNVFIFVGGLAGGTIGAAVAAALAIAYRLYLGGPGTMVGVGAVTIAALIASLVARRYGARVREFGAARLMGLGLVIGLATFLWGQTLFTMRGLPLLPAEATIALLLLYPVTTMLLGMAVNMVHYDTWHRAQLRASAELQERDEQLRASREHLARAQHVGGVGSIEVDIAADKGVWSDELYRLLGLAPADNSFEYFLSAIHPDDRAAMRSDRAALLRGEPLATRDYRIVRPDGEPRWLRRQVEIIRDAAGNPVRHVSTYLDVTELKRAEAQLRESREHLALAQQVAQVGSGEVDLATGRVFVTDVTYEILGYDPADTQIGYDAMLERVHPDDRAMMLALYQRSRAGEDTEPCEFRIVRPDGGVRWLRRVASTRRDAAGRAVKVVSTVQDITDRKRFEVELTERDERRRRSERHLASAQRVGKMGSVEVDVATGKSVWSIGQYHMFGFHPFDGQPSDEQFYAIVHPEDRDMLRKLAADERERGATHPVDYRVVGAGGAVRWIHRQAEAVRDAEERISRWIIVHQDVTDRRRTEADLRESEEQLRHSRDHLARAQETGSVASTEVDLVTQAAYWSDYAYTLFGLDRATTLPGLESFLAAVHPEDRERMRAIAVAARAGEETLPGDFRVLRPSGEVRWLHRVADIVRDPEGRPVRVIATVIDVTERKRAEAALLEREAQLRQASERLALAQQIAALSSMDMDYATGAIRWSEGVYELLGVDPATATPSVALFRSFVHPEDQALFDLVGERVRAGIDIEPGEIRIVRADGGLRWVLRSIRVLRDAAGVPFRSLATLQDITERKVAQLERQELERQLTQAQKMEAVGNLTGGVAHDFNNLLSVILGRLEMAQEELADRPQVRGWIRTCINAANRGAVLTRSMLAFSRQQPLAPVQIDLTEALRDIIALLPRTLGETIELEVKRAPDLWRCVADPAQLQNALLNLALNARDAMPRGGKLTISAQNAHLDEYYAAQNAGVAVGDYVALAVSDTGVGMSAHVMARAFEPFFTTKEVGRGSGLGLSMVYGFARQSGGHVKIYSELDHGTTVTLYLPRGLGAAEVLGAAPASLPLLEGSGTIVVVEDDDEMRALATTQLERLGYTVRAASTGPDALEAIDRNPEVMLLLTDLTLPGGLSGRELARRAQGRLPHLRVLFMSGYAEDAARLHGRIDADVGLLQKPFGMRELREALHAVLH